MQLTSQSWVEIGRQALQRNVQTFRQLVGPEKAIMVVVKANAYGHGLVPVAQTALAAGADWLAVFAPDEAFALRQAGVETPILVLGPTPAELLARLAAEETHITVAGPEAVEAVLAAGVAGLQVHVKLETGTHRQGFLATELAAVKRMADAGHVVLAGAYTHFADIEDTTDHSFAMIQLERFKELVARLADLGLRPRKLHTACSAATLLFADTYFDMVRVGISLYGLWPSKETLVSVKQSGQSPAQLRPVMTWKTRIAQTKSVPAGITVGYGRTYQTTRPSRLAVLPVGYANGYDRALSNKAHVLVHGQRAGVCGRVMMNMMIVDITDIAAAAAGDEVVLLGNQGNDAISAELMASWSDTINYEVVSRVEPGAPRRLV